MRHDTEASPEPSTAPTVSVVIATFNRAARLKRTLEALRCQRYLPDDEVIVVDNGSSDETASVIQMASRDYPVPLRRLTEPVRGKGPALARGVAAARGSILALTDDDVVVARDWVATIRQVFRHPSAALVGGRVQSGLGVPAPAMVTRGPRRAVPA